MSAPLYGRDLVAPAIRSFWFTFGFPIGLAVGMVIATGADLAGVKRDHEALHRANLTIRCMEGALLASDGVVFVSVPQFREAFARRADDAAACRELAAIRAEEEASASKARIQAERKRSGVASPSPGPFAPRRAGAPVPAGPSVPATETQ